jgi:hypothetical protein
VAARLRVDRSEAYAAILGNACGAAQVATRQQDCEFLAAEPAEVVNAPAEVLAGIGNVP